MLTLSTAQYEEESGEKYSQNEISSQDDVTKNSHGLSLYPEGVQKIDNALEESASTKGAEIKIPEVIKSSLRGGSIKRNRRKRI
jgi:hypothetical protein